MVFRERRPSRHRAADGKTPDAVPNHELESFLALISPNGKNSSSELTTRFGSAQAFQLRLPELRIEQLRRLAKARGVSATELVMDWVLERLDRDDPADRADLAPGPDPSAVAPAPSREVDPGPADAPQPATAWLSEGIGAEPVAQLSPVDQLNPIGELTPVSPAAPVTLLFRGASGAHAMGVSEGKEKSRGPRHRAPEPVTSLHTRRKF
jgi:hypothetical protein